MARKYKQLRNRQERHTARQVIHLGDIDQMLSLERILIPFNRFLAHQQETVAVEAVPLRQEIVEQHATLLREYNSIEWFELSARRAVWDHIQELGSTKAEEVAATRIAEAARDLKEAAHARARYNCGLALADIPF